MSDIAPLLRAAGLSAAYGRRTILRDVNLEIGRGEFWFFLGPNGQGKTTLLRCFLGMLRPRSGELWRNPSLEGHQGIGFVPQQCDLNPNLPTTVKEFVLLGLSGIRCARREQVERLAEALQKVGLEGKQDNDYWRLSGGQRQRALVARALVRRPNLLILDEPTSGLDLSAEESLLRFLCDLNQKEKLTILCVTHDLPLAARYGSHFALFHDGIVIAGSKEQVLHKENLDRAYGLPVGLAIYPVVATPAPP